MASAFSYQDFEVDLLLSILNECDLLRIQRNKDYPLVAMQGQQDEHFVIMSLQVVLLQKTNRHQEYFEVRMKWIDKVKEQNDKQGTRIGTVFKLVTLVETAHEKSQRQYDIEQCYKEAVDAMLALDTYLKEPNTPAEAQIFAA
jgi:hypothetical protein